MIDANLLEILRCPSNRSSLAEADAGIVARLNRGIVAGKLKSVGGQIVKKPIDGGLIREAGDLLYPIVDQIPVMLPDEAIELSQVGEDW